MGLEESLKLALEMGSNAKFSVCIGDDIFETMTYLELGTYLIINAMFIENVVIKLKS